MRPFELVVDDVVFGLIRHEWQEDGHDWSRVELEPGSLSFTAPWDGLYDT